MKEVNKENEQAFDIHVVSMYCDCDKPTLGVNTWTCGCGKWFKKVKK